jgi:hypothetical protein
LITVTTGGKFATQRCRQQIDTGVNDAGSKLLPVVNKNNNKRLSSPEIVH